MRTHLCLCVLLSSLRSAYPYVYTCAYAYVSDILPNPQYSSQHTQSANTNGLQFQISLGKTATYQKSYLLRTTRVWNILPRDLTNNGLTFKEFKKKLSNYYSSALDNCYDVDDPQKWKSVCIKYAIKPET